MRKIGRNEPCPCLSGLKYKKCHGKPTDGVRRNLCAVTGAYTKNLWKGKPVHPAIIDLAKRQIVKRDKNGKPKTTMRNRLQALRTNFMRFKDSWDSEPKTHAGWAVKVNEFIKMEWNLS